MMREPTEKERFTVLLENIETKVNIVLEGQSSLRIELKTEIQELRNDLLPRVETIEKVVTSINEQLIPMQFVLSDHEHRIKKIETSHK